MAGTVGHVLLVVFRPLFSAMMRLYMLIVPWSSEHEAEGALRALERAAFQICWDFPPDHVSACLSSRRTIL